MTLITIREKSVNKAWQTALARVIRNGVSIKTEYDDLDDLPSKDATAAIEITEPFKHPLKVRGRTHEIRSRTGNSWTIYGCIADTYLIGSIQSNYIEEIIDGINDRYLFESEKSFPYSYHDRIFNWKPYSLENVGQVQYDLTGYDMKKVFQNNKQDTRPKSDGTKLWEVRENGLVYEIYNNDRQFDLYSMPPGFDKEFGIPIEIVDFPGINQLEPIAKKLAKMPHSRRCQFITWRPYADPYSRDPPCLQRGWFRVIDDKLKMQTIWRSRDLFRAWEANVNGMLYIQKILLDKINKHRRKRGDREFDLGSYTDFSNSLHIYGESFSELADVVERLIKRDQAVPELADTYELLQEMAENKSHRNDR